MTTLARELEHIPSSHGCCSFSWCPSHQEQHATLAACSSASEFESRSQYHRLIPHCYGVDKWTARSDLFRNGTRMHAGRRKHLSRLQGIGFSTVSHLAHERGQRGDQGDVALRGGASCPANQAATSSCCQGERLEHLFRESSALRNSGKLFSRSGPTNRRSACRKSQAARSGMLISSSRASASPTPRSPMPCSARYWTNERCCA